MLSPLVDYINPSYPLHCPLIFAIIFPPFPHPHSISPLQWTLSLGDYGTSTRRSRMRALLKTCNSAFIVPTTCSMLETQGALLVTDNRVFIGPCSLCLFARIPRANFTQSTRSPDSAHSDHSLNSAPLRCACFAHSLRFQARSNTLLTPWLKIMSMYSC